MTENEVTFAPSLTSLNSQKIGSKFTLEKVPEPDDRPPLPSARHLWGKSRYLILVLSVICFTAARSNDMTFTFSVICMTGNSSSGVSPLLFTPSDLSLSFAGAGTGAILAALPCALLLQQFGGRTVMALILTFSSVATLILPSAAEYAMSINWPISSFVFPLRILQGIAVSAVMPMMGFISAQWAPISEIGSFMTLLSSSGQLSQIFTMPVSAHLCVTAGWPWAYYFHGTISVFAAMLFWFFFTNSPKKNRFISDYEVYEITNGVQHRKRKEQKIPYRAILKSKSVWAVWLAFLGNAFGFQLIIQFMPTYLNKVLSVPIEKTGFSAILPPIAQLVMKLIAGATSDRITCISERRKLQIFNTAAMCGSALFLLPLGYLHEEQAGIAIACITIAISCLGLITCGCMKSAPMVARQYSHFVMSIVQFVMCIAMLIVPFLVSTLAPNNKIEEWRFVFLTVSVILFTANFGFCAWCDSEAAPWTKDINDLPSSKRIPLLSDDPQATVATIAED